MKTSSNYYRSCLLKFRELLNPHLNATQKKSSKMVFYRNRLKTFTSWPFTSEADTCSPENMAKAGFYSISKKKSDTSVKCFCCLKELDGWEAKDDPWEEHKAHQQDCPFIQLNKLEPDWTLEDWMNMQHSSAIKLLVSGRIYFLNILMWVAE